MILQRIVLSVNKIMILTISAVVVHQVILVQIVLFKHVITVKELQIVQIQLPLVVLVHVLLSVGPEPPVPSVIQPVDTVVQTALPITVMVKE